MNNVMKGRFSAEREESFVVFVIGMRINDLLRVRKWVPTVRAMGPMLRELYAEEEKGFLGAENFFYWCGVALIQYWRSFEELERFARDREASHLPAWRRFNRSIGPDGSVGIWHETFLVEKGAYQSIYVNMPVFGLARATDHVPATGRRGGVY